MSATKRKKMRSIYVDDDVLGELEKRARSQQLSLNAYISKVIERELDYPFGVAPIVGLGEAFLAKYLQSHGEEVVSGAREMGETDAREWLALTGKPPVISSFVFFVRGHSEYAGWAGYEERRSASRIIMILTHRRGETWSRYMKEYFQASLAEMAGGESISEEAFKIVNLGLVITLSGTGEPGFVRVSERK